MPRKKHKYHFIYKTTNKLNNKFYVGMHSTDNLNDGYIGSGDRIRRSIKKYGKENFNFEILNFFPDRKTLKENEKNIINEDFLKNELCMNICLGGGGGYISPEGVKKGRQKTDEILKEKYGDDFRVIINKKFHSEMSEEKRNEYRMKISKSLKERYKETHGTFLGKKHTDKTKILIGNKNSINQKGVKNSQFGTCWITNGVENKKIKVSDVISSGWYLGRKIK